MADDNVTFPMPQGFEPPENLKSDDTFQAMATFRVTGDEELELVEIDGHQVGEGDEEELQQTEQANAAAALQGGGGPTAGPPGGPPPPPTGNMSEDRVPPGAPAEQLAPGFAETMGQKFKTAMKNIAKARK